MKIPLAILAITAICLAIFWWLGPRPDPSLAPDLVDLPWQVTELGDGTSRVFDLHLGEATLADATQKFGPYEDMAIFVTNEGQKSLEIYFGAVQFGPLKAKIIITLEASDSDLDDLLSTARERLGSPSGDWKFKLSTTPDQAHQQRKIKSISYLPNYRGLEADFFRHRLGEPTAWKKINDNSVQWFYPKKGLSLLLNSAGQEVLEYSLPRTFEIPSDSVFNGR